MYALGDIEADPSVERSVQSPLTRDYGDLVIFLGDLPSRFQ